MAQFWTTARLTRIIIKASATLFATGLAGSVWYGGPMTTRVDAADLLAQSGGLAAPAKVEHSGEVTTEYRIVGLDPEELV